MKKLLLIALLLPTPALADDPNATSMYNSYTPPTEPTFQQQWDRANQEDQMRKLDSRVRQLENRSPAEAMYDAGYQ